MAGRILTWILALVLAPIGIVLIAGGFTLIREGGSWYYLAAGLATLATAVLLVFRKKQAFQVYAGLLVVTLVWSLWEAGLDAWALAPRVIGPAVLGLCLLTGPIRRFAGGAKARWVGLPVLASVLLMGIAVAAEFAGRPDLPAAQVIAAHAEGQDEWRHWGRTQGGERFAPIGQITAQNIDKLEVAWRWDSTAKPFPGGMKATPLLIDGRLITCSDANTVVALDPESGKQLWLADPQLDRKGLFFATCRGVSYAEAPQASDCPKRIVWGTADMRLMAVDAATGKPCESFGTHGAVDLKLGMGVLKPGEAMITSPPAIVNGVAVLGAFISDGMPSPSAPGVVRGYDVATGAFKWAWETDRTEPSGLPAEGQSYARDTPNAWSVFSGDDALGLVYLPMGNIPPDTFGARRRPEADRYSSAIVALEAATGRLRWAFQTSHHDLWDWDIPAQPVLTELNGTPALIASTKRGEFFVLDRRTGTPIDRVEERPVPQGNLGGDKTAPTQPYTTGFPSMAGPRLTEADMWGLTPLDQMWCRIQFARARYEGDFTPPSAPSSIQYPGSPGGSSWGGVSVDPAHRRMVAMTLHLADLHTIVPPGDLDKVKGARAASKRLGTPYAIMRTTFLSPLLAPCQKPPYGKISVYDLDSRKLLWSRPLGTAEETGPFDEATHLPLLMGVPNRAGAGSLTTAGGLIFTAAGGDSRLHVYDIGSGREVRSIKMPQGGASNPISYVGRDGRQYIVVGAAPQGATFVLGMPKKLADRKPSAPPILIAYALPKR